MSKAHEVAKRCAEAASRLVDLLDQRQRELVCWAFDDAVEREQWFYTPTDHGGLALSAMTPVQQRAVWQLIAAGTSMAGYNTVASIVGHDNILDRVEGFTVDWGRERGREPGLYYLRIFGNPTESEPWSWRFGGHHVSLNITIIDDQVQGATPCFLGVDPATSPLLGGHLLRPMGAAEDLGRELVRSLDETQRRSAIVNAVAPTDLVSANRTRYGQGEGDLALPLIDVWRGRFEGALGDIVTKIQRDAEEKDHVTAEVLESLRLTSTPIGLSVTAMNASQREMLRALLDVYVARVPEGLADLEAAKYASDDQLETLSFCWAGGLEAGEGHYYRVQGPSLLCEYDNTQRGANHVHTVWRDPSRDFGANPLAEHYRHDH